MLVIGSVKDACAGLWVGLRATASTPAVFVSCTDDACMGPGVMIWTAVSAEELITVYVSMACAELEGEGCVARSEVVLVEASVIDARGGVDVCTALRVRVWAAVSSAELVVGSVHKTCVKLGRLRRHVGSCVCRWLCGNSLCGASVCGFRLLAGGGACRQLCVRRPRRHGVEAQGLAHVSTLSVVFVCAREDCTAVRGRCRLPCQRWCSLTASRQLNACHCEVGNGAPSWRCRGSLAGPASTARRQCGGLSHCVSDVGVVSVTHKDCVAMLVGLFLPRHQCLGLPYAFMP